MIKTNLTWLMDVDEFLVIVIVILIGIPITSTLRPIPFHITVQPPKGGLTNASALLCEAVHSISKDRLIQRLGSITPATMAIVEDRLRVLMGL